MNTIEDLLKDAMDYEEKVLIYYIMFALKKGKVRMEDPEEKFDSIIFTEQEKKEIARLIEENPLKIDRVNIYSLKMDKTRYAMIFAKSKKEAIRYYVEKFKKKPLNCYEFLLDYQVMQGKKAVSFWELRKQFDSFPAYAGYMETPKYR